MTTATSEILDDQVPEHCGRQMWSVKNRSHNELPYNSPIWWCAECHHHQPRAEEEVAS